MPSELYVTQRAPLASIFQYQQAHALKEKGIKIGIVSAGFVPFSMMFSKYPYSAFEMDNGINTFRCYKRIFIPGRIAVTVFLKYLVGLYLKTFEKYITSHGKPDIIHAHNCLYAGVVALNIKVKYSIPYLITEHSSAYARGIVQSNQTRLIKRVLKEAEVRTVVSTSLGKSLENLFGTDACPYYPIWNMLDDMFERGGHIWKDKGNNKNVFTFLSIGCLDVNKNHSDLLKAFACKFKGNGAVRLKIGGNGPLRKQLGIETNKLGIDGQVIFTGLLSRDGVLQEIQKCNVFVLSSIVETFGVVLIEALALGKPLVATECGGPEDIVNQANGILVPKKNIDALAEAMWNVYINNKRYDTNKIRSDCLLSFGKDSFVKRLINIYMSILYRREQESKDMHIVEAKSCLD